MTDPFIAPCRYCLQDVMPPTSLPHAENCPSNTGIYPVEERDVMCSCPCGDASHESGLVCGECETALEVGDHYALLSLSESSRLIVCLMCAATLKEATRD